MAADALERRTMLQVWRRIVPLLGAVLVLSYLDRVNVGFAALQMNQALGLSNAVFGMVAGSFALGYALFGIPSTLLMNRFGARRWISLIMLVWGLASAATAFVTRAEELLLLRVLLGAAEAGFTPGAVLYLSRWFPNEYRGRVLASFWCIGPLAIVIGGPLSAVLLTMDGRLGLEGWQWLFLLEALPTILFAVIVYACLIDSPESASWLEPSKREWLSRRLAEEKSRVEQRSPLSSWRVIGDGRVLALAAVYIAVGTCGAGSVLFMPLLIHSMGISTLGAGILTAVPAAIAVLTAPLWGVWADRARHRSTVVAATCCVLAAGLAGTALLFPSYWALLPLCAAMSGFYGFVGPFWTLPSLFLAGTAAATGVAFINMVGNVGQFAGPALLGWLTDRSGSQVVGLACLAAMALAAAVMLFAQGADRRRLPVVEPS